MRVYTSKPLPSAQELAGILKAEFSSAYHYKLFGAGNEKSIIVQQSALVGAQISAHGNEFTIQGIAPTVTAGLLATLSQGLVNLFLRFSPSSYRAFEKEVAVFLQRKYA